MEKILFIDNTAHHLFGQMHLVNAFVRDGYEVEAIVPDDGDYFNKLVKAGIKCHTIKINGKGLNPFADMALIKEFKNRFLEIKPNLICTFTIKPNLYAAIAAREYKIPVIAGVTGLGTAFLRKNILNKIVVGLYKHAFKKLGCVFFQNKDDQSTFKQLNIIKSDTLSIALPGDGVNLDRFNYVGMANTNEMVSFLYLGRLIGDKGLYELISATRKVKLSYPNICVMFGGNYFPGNPTAISELQVSQWVDEGVIRYLGMVDNVPSIIAQSDCVVLPSYREGMPRSILEASSMGKPVITVNSIGCKDAVDDGITGFIAQVKDVDSLATAMISFIELSYDKKVEMGLQGRRKMEREFDQTIVVNKYLEVVKQLLNK